MEPKVGLGDLCSTEKINFDKIYDLINNNGENCTGTELLVLAILLYPNIVKGLIEKNKFDGSVRSLSYFKDN